MFAKVILLLFTFSFCYGTNDIRLTNGHLNKIFENASFSELNAHESNFSITFSSDVPILQQEDIHNQTKNNTDTSFIIPIISNNLSNSSKDYYIIPSNSSTSSTSSWFRSSNFTHFPHSKPSSLSNTNYKIKLDFNHNSINFQHGYLVVRNTIRAAIKPFMRWIQQNSIKLFKQTVVFVRASHIYICTVFTEIKCEYIKQSKRFDLYLQTLDNDTNITNNPMSEHYSPFTMSTPHSWLSPDDILMSASNGMKNNMFTSTSGTVHSTSSSTHLSSSILPDLSSKLSNKNLKIKSNVGSKQYTTTTNDDNMNSNNCDEQNNKKECNFTTSKYDLNTKNSSFMHDNINISNSGNTINSNDFITQQQSVSNLDKNSTNKQQTIYTSYYIFHYILAYITKIYLQYLSPSCHYVYNLLIAQINSNLYFDLFTINSLFGDSSLNDEKNVIDGNFHNTNYSSSISILGPSLLLSFIFIAFMASVLQIWGSIPHVTTNSLSSHTIPNTSATASIWRYSPFKLLSPVSNHNNNISTSSNSSTNIISFNDNYNNNKKSISYISYTYIFQIIIFLLKVLLLAIIVFALYSYFVALETIQIRRLEHRIKVKAVNDYILKSSNYIKGSNHTIRNDQNKDNNHWVNTVVNAFWLIGSNGGIGPYISETVETVLNTELAQVPPGIANIKLAKFNFGVDPPIIRTITAQYDIRTNSHCHSLFSSKSQSPPSTALNNNQNQRSQSHSQSHSSTLSSQYESNSEKASGTVSNTNQEETIKTTKNKFETREKDSVKPSYMNSNTNHIDSSNNKETNKTEKDIINDKNTTNSNFTSSNNNTDNNYNHKTNSINKSSSSLGENDFQEKNKDTVINTIWNDIFASVQQKISSMRHSTINTTFPFPHYNYDLPRPPRSSSGGSRDFNRNKPYHYKKVRHDEIIRGCQVLTADIELGYISKNLDIVFALRPNDAQTLYPEIHVALTDFSFSGHLKFEFELIPEYPFIGNTTFSFLEVPSVDMTISGFGSVDLSSLPGVYNLVNSTVHWLLLQYTQPNSGQFDMKPILCPSCIVPVTTPMSTFKTKLYDTLSVLSNRTAILGQELKAKTSVYSQQLNSIVQQNLQKMKISQKIQLFSNFMENRTEWIMNELEHDME